MRARHDWFCFTSDWMKIGANLLRQPRSLVIAKPITFRHLNENRSSNMFTLYMTCKI